MSSELAGLVQAAVGPPEGWQAAALGDLFAVSTPGHWGDEPDGDGNIMVLRSTNFRKAGGLNYETAAPRQFDARKVIQKRLEVGDIILERSGGSPAQPVGRARRFEAEGCYSASNFMQIMRPCDHVDDWFACYLLDYIYDRGLTEPLQKATTGIRNLDYKTYLDLPISVPPIDEQRRIAEVLRSVDEAVAQTKVTVEQASRAIAGMLQRLFVEGIGHSDFKEGHSSHIPASWNEKSLGELSVTPVTYGVVQPGPNVVDGIPFVRGGDFPNGTINIGALRKIGRDVASQYRRTQLKGGEIVVSLVGYPGACAIVPNELAGANIARQAALIRPGKEIVASYLYQFLRSPIGQGRLKKETIGSAQQVINLRDLKEVIVALPPKHEQEHIAAILADLDGFVRLETANLDKLTALKGGIAADLLSGRVRVPA